MSEATLRPTQCPVCEGGNIELYLEGQERDFNASVIGSSRERIFSGRILRCRSCEFAFRQFRSSSEELNQLYRKMDTTVYELELRGRERTASKHLGIVERHTKPGRILDVGCASGLFLRQALHSGWDVAGVEPSETLCREAVKNLENKGEIQCVALEDAHFTGTFDAITLWDVLEHVSDPNGFLSICRNLLNNDGHLFLNVPNLDSLEARILGRRWPLLLPEHLNYFNVRSLKVCASQAGLNSIQFGRRFAFFSTRYVTERVAQHQIIGSTLLRKAAKGFLGRLLIPVSLGELFAVLKAV
jgi:SAM-dependent methyltransferase